MYRDLWQALGGPRRQCLKWTLEWLATPLRDFVILKRVTLGREGVASWQIIERNAEGVSRLRENGKSYIIAGGHFTRPGYLALVSPQVTPGNIIDAFARPPRIRSLRDLRLNITYRTSLRARSYAGKPFEVAWVGEGSLPGLALYRALRQPNTVAVVHVDAPWPPNLRSSYQRSFAGNTSRSFSMGVVHLARKANCPVVPCAYSFDGERAIIDWGDPIFPDGEPSDVMDRILATLERAVARNPGQYLLDIGKGRRWNPARAAWESPG